MLASTRGRLRSSLILTAAALALVVSACSGGDGTGGTTDGRIADANGEDSGVPPADVALPDGGGTADGAAGDGFVKPDGGAPETVSDDAGDGGTAPDLVGDGGAPADAPTPEDVRPPCETGATCDDGDPCTMGDVCRDGVCAGTPYACDDDLACTADACGGDGTCAFVLRGGWCLIDGACFEDGDAHPGDPCLACLPPLATDDWSPGPAAPCDDGDACTDGDTCHDGVCRSGDPLDCGAGDPCVDSACDPASGCVVAYRDGLPCDDGDACTTGDVCDDGGCLPGPTALLCADDNPCTDDVCDALAGCTFVANTAACDDGDPCTEGESCQAGECVAPGGPSCDDGNPCTDDACAPGEGCVHANNTAGCDDADPCSVGDRCVAGICRGGSARPDCADENPCTDDVCTPRVGCENPPNTNPCDDDDVCTVDDHCGGGACQPGAPLECDDEDPCTDDVCDAARGCIYTNNAGGCDDDNPCTVGDLCLDGLCLPGPDPADCDDQDPCTNDSCLPDLGCVNDPASGLPCQDGDPCTIGDLCATGECRPGIGRLSCDDGNPCSLDECTPFAGCTNTPLLGGPCDDESVCTEADRCIEGECVGYEMLCSDGNPCTADLCDPIEGCVFEPIQTIDCWPILSISPQRGATVVGGDVVTVWGSVVGIAAPVSSLVINDEDIPFDPTTGAFSLELPSSHGMNLLRVDVEDELGTRREVRQSFYLSGAYWPMDPANWETSRIPEAILFYLSEQVVDDGDRADVDDLASIFQILLGTMNLNQLIPRPAARQTIDLGGIADCTYTIYVNNITHGVPQVTLQPQDGGRLRVLVTIASFRALVDANGDAWYCPNIDATVTASSIVVDTTVALGFSGGAISASVVSNDVAINGLNVSGGDVLSDLLLGLFESQIRSQLESAFEDQIAGLIPGMLQDALGQLAISQSFSIPAFLPGQSEATVTLDSKMSSFTLASDGIHVGLAAVIMGPQAVPYDIEGSIARGTCQGHDSGFPDPIREAYNLELALFDDLLNQVLYSVWAAGSFEFALTAEQLGQDLTGFGIESLDLDVSFLLPPIVEWCDPEQPLLLQIGDIGIDATFTLLGQPLDVTMFASVEAAGGIELATNDAGALELGLAISEIRTVVVDIASVNAGYEEFIPILRDMIEAQLLPALLGGLSDGALGGFPIPTIDLSGFDASIPAGTGIAISPQELWRQDGYTAVGGDMQSSQ